MYSPLVLVSVTSISAWIVVRRMTSTRLRTLLLWPCSMLLKPFMAMAGDVVYRRGEIGRELYLLAALILTVPHEQNPCEYPLGFT